MAVSWNFYSARRRVSIKEYVERRGLSSYGELVADLASRGISSPTEAEYSSEVGTSVPQVPAPKQQKSKSVKAKGAVPNKKPRVKAKAKPSPAKLPISEADEAWEAVNSESSEKDTK